MINDGPYVEQLMKFSLYKLVSCYVHVYHPYGFVEGTLEQHGDMFKVYVVNNLDKAHVSFHFDSIQRLTQNVIYLKD
jgi:hypothetical protein